MEAKRFLQMVHSYHKAILRGDIQEFPAFLVLKHDLDDLRKKGKISGNAKAWFERKLINFL